MSRVEARELRGVSAEQAFELVSGVVMGINDAYPYLGTVERYRLMADSLPERVETRLQQELLMVAQSGRGEERNQAAYTFLMLSLKTVLTVTEEYFNGDSERDADLLAAGMLGLVERLPTLDPQSYPLTTYVHAAVVGGVAEFMAQTEGMSPSLVRWGVSREVERTVDRLVQHYPWGVGPKQRNNLARRLADRFAGRVGDSSGEVAVRRYIRGRLENLPDPLGHVSDAEAEVYELFMQKEVKAAIAFLPETEQETLWLRYWEGLTLDETAERLGTTRDKVRGIEAIALRRLRSPGRLRGLRGWWRD